MNVVLGENLTAIGSYAFNYCYKLIEVINESSLEIYVQDNSYNSYVSSYAISVKNNQEDTGFFTATDYTVYDFYGNYYLLDYNGAETEITLPSNINGNHYYVYPYAFYNKNDVTKIDIGNGVYGIGAYAFGGLECLTSVTIGESVTTIGSYAFALCESLEKVYYNGTIDKWAEIDFENSFANPLSYAKELYINDSLVTQANLTSATKVSAYAFYNYDKLTAITLGNAVETIGIEAFYGCDNLETSRIEDSLISIGEYAFYSCDKLTEIIYSGTQTEWYNITKGNSWDTGTGEYTVQCSNGNVAKS